MIQDDEGKITKVNGHRLKVFLTPSELNEVVDIISLIDFNKLHLLNNHESPATSSPKPFKPRNT